MSSRKTYKEVKESIRNEVCRNYTHRIESLRNRINDLLSLVEIVKKERDEAREKLRETECELDRYKDWVERLCDYCNLSDEERQLLLEETDKLKRKVEKSERYEQYVYNSQLFKFLNYIQ